MPRHTAYTVLRRIEDGAYSHLALSAELDRAHLDDRDRGLATRLVYGTLTWQRALDEVLSRRVRKGVRSLDDEVRTILRLGAFQLLFLDRIPDHAAVDESVELAKRHAKGGADRLVNAVLRKLADEAGEVSWFDPADRERKPARYIGQRWSLPNWLGNRLVQQFGVERADAIGAAFAAEPPLYGRATGEAEGLEVEAVEGVPGALRAPALTAPLREAIAQGRFLVQDLGSQLIGHFAMAGEAGAAGGEERLLDGCAGLGGKTLLLASLAPGAAIDAVEPNTSKLELLVEGAARLGLSERITVHEASLQSFAEAAPREPWHRVLVDAPCTGLGILRRHPETRWQRSEADIQSLAKVQAELLDAAADLVAPGGLLVYSVCTFTREETSKQVERFLERRADFALEPSLADGDGGEIDWSRFTDEAGCLAVMPDLHDTDGFFAARLKKT